MKNRNTEAIQFTSKNLGIVKKFAEPASYFANGILLSGSNAWGANYAVTKKSDIDLLIVVDDIEELEKIVERYITEGLLNPDEQNRFNVFNQLSLQKRAEQFSIIVNYSGTPVSLDFFNLSMLERITSLGPMKTCSCEAANVRVINEFRANPPRVSGYSLDELGGSRKRIYHPKFEEIKDNQGSIVGYLSETLVDGQAVTDNGSAYLLGVMAFFLAISPSILVDKEKRLIKAIRTLQSNIRKMTKGEIPIYITRQERMSEDTLKRIQNDLVTSFS